MRIVPLTVKQANALVKELHRHHKPVPGHRFSIGLRHMDRLVGAAIVGRAVARETDQYMVAEVTRLVTDGSTNACSQLYGACARIAKEMGFDEIQSFTLPSEGGASLRASGWECLGVVRKDGVGWNNRSGRRVDQPTEAKWKWRKILHKGHD